MSPRSAQRWAAGFGFAGVSLGAFGAHLLEKILIQNETVEIWETAVLYHLVHAVVLLTLSRSHAVLRTAFVSFASGTAVFSGTLYVLALTGVKWLGAITPIGGVLLLVGWGMLFFQKDGESSHE